MRNQISEGRSDLPPLPSRATRSIAKRSKSSSRGGVVVQLPTWDRPRIVYFESKLEQRVLFLILARKDVVDVWEQPPFVTYQDTNGRRKHHFFDYLVELQSGRRLAIAVKPAKLARRSGFVSDLRLIRQAVQKDFADDVLLITNEDFTKEAAHNAERYYDFCRSKDAELTERLASIVPGVSFPITVADLASKLSAGGAGYRTVFIAIYEGLLAADKDTLIDAATLVTMREQ